MDINKVTYAVGQVVWEVLRKLIKQTRLVGSGRVIAVTVKGLTEQMRFE